MTHAAGRGSAFQRVQGPARASALLGGLLLLGLAVLVTGSIAGRAGGLGAVPGDFELVQMGMAVAVFAFLPWCQARRQHVIVDSLTHALPRRVQAGLDALWDGLLALAAGVMAWRLAVGAADAAASRTTTMVLGLPSAPAIALCALLAAGLALVALASAWDRVARPGPPEPGP